MRVSVFTLGRGHLSSRRDRTTTPTVATSTSVPTIWKGRLKEARSDDGSTDDRWEVELSSRLRFEVEEHDDEEEQHHDRPSIDEDLDGPDEEGV